MYRYYGIENSNINNNYVIFNRLCFTLTEEYVNEEKQANAIINCLYEVCIDLAYHKNVKENVNFDSIFAFIDFILSSITKCYIPNDITDVSGLEELYKFYKFMDNTDNIFRIYKDTPLTINDKYSSSYPHLTNPLDVENIIHKKVIDLVNNFFKDSLNLKIDFLLYLLSTAIYKNRPNIELNQNSCIHDFTYYDLNYKAYNATFNVHFCKTTKKLFFKTHFLKSFYLRNIYHPGEDEDKNSSMFITFNNKSPNVEDGNLFYKYPFTIMLCDENNLPNVIQQNLKDNFVINISPTISNLTLINAEEINCAKIYNYYNNNPNLLYSNKRLDKFKNNLIDKNLCNNILKETEVIFFYGSSGSGKSTTIKALKDKNITLEIDIYPEYLNKNNKKNINFYTFSKFEPTYNSNFKKACVENESSNRCLRLHQLIDVDKSKKEKTYSIFFLDTIDFESVCIKKGNKYLLHYPQDLIMLNFLNGNANSQVSKETLDKMYIPNFIPKDSLESVNYDINEYHNRVNELLFGFNTVMEVMFLGDSKISYNNEVFDYNDNDNYRKKIGDTNKILNFIEKDMSSWKIKNVLLVNPSNYTRDISIFKLLNILKNKISKDFDKNELLKRYYNYLSINHIILSINNVVPKRNFN